jgi:hypothetical protein
MAMQDVIDAINATIVPNNAKAINADSLRNLLLLMTENMGSGGGSSSGDGALRVIVPELMLFGSDIIAATEGELSPSSWAIVKPILEDELGVDFSEYGAVVNASFAHNANVLQQIIAKARVGKGVSILLDKTPYYPAATSIVLRMEPETAAMIEEAFYSSAQPASYIMTYVKPTPEGETIMGEGQLSCALIPAGWTSAEELGPVNYSPNIVIELLSDGSLKFHSDTESAS